MVQEIKDGLYKSEFTTTDKEFVEEYREWVAREFEHNESKALKCAVRQAMQRGELEA